MPEPRLELKSLKVRDIVAEYNSGKIVVPEFQREYVWKPGKAPKLIDSLYRDFPISVVLLWASEDSVRARRRDLLPTRSGLVSWLIDGQQRVTTLSKVLGGDGDIHVVFHPELEEFRLATAKRARDTDWLYVSQLLNDDQYRQIRGQLPDNEWGRMREARLDRVRRILDYPIPVVRMLDHSFDAAVEAFTRINTYGAKLKTQDIESARIAARHGGFIADRVSPFLHELRRRGYTRMNVMHLFRICAFVARPDGRTRTPLHELEESQVLRAWDETKLAVEEAVTLLRDEFGFVNMDILWSGALLVPVAAYCAMVSGRERDSKGIAGWLAVASLAHRYGSGTESALDQDLRACRKPDPIGSLLSNCRRDSGGLGAKAKDFAGTFMDKGALLAAYVACRQRGLRDLFGDHSAVQQLTMERHHLFPRAQFSPGVRATADTIANMAFINGAARRPPSMLPPEIFLRRASEGVLRSQCVPCDSRLWHIDQVERFWGERRRLLADAFNDCLRALLPNRHIASA